MGAKNMVIAGSYMGRGITRVAGVVQIFLDRTNYILLDKFSIDNYQVVSEKSEKSFASGAARSLIGVALFGDPGLLAGAASAKTRGIYTVAIQWKDGKRSLLELDEKTYETFVRGMF